MLVTYYDRENLFKIFFYMLKASFCFYLKHIILVEIEIDLEIFCTRWQLYLEGRPSRKMSDLV